MHESIHTSMQGKETSDLSRHIFCSKRVAILELVLRGGPTEKSPRSFI